MDCLTISTLDVFVGIALALILGIVIGHYHKDWKL